MKSIGLLYIATGKYIVFWKEFYDTFETHFLPKTEKHYYVFTDAESFYQEENERVHKIYLKAEPWPLPTLLKFHRFLEIEEDLLKHDYLYQPNGSVTCVKDVLEEDFLPREELGEELMFTRHPGYYNRKPCRFPYERSRESMAYVPYNCGATYVFGAMNGGTSSAYISLIKQLDYQVIEDLKKGIIAIFHDESHINHNVISLNNYRLLPMAYARQEGATVPGDCIILCVDKSKYFDVDTMKGVYKDAESLFGKVFQKGKFFCVKHILVPFWVLRDTLMRRNVQ